MIRADYRRLATCIDRLLRQLAEKLKKSKKPNSGVVLIGQPGQGMHRHLIESHSMNLIQRSDRIKGKPGFCSSTYANASS